MHPVSSAVRAFVLFLIVSLNVFDFLYVESKICWLQRTRLPKALPYFQDLELLG